MLELIISLRIYIQDHMMSDFIETTLLLVSFDNFKFFLIFFLQNIENKFQLSVF